MHFISRVWRRWQGWIKIIFTVALLGYLLKIMPIATVWQQLSLLTPVSLGISFMILLLSVLLFAYAWAIILRILDFKLPIQTVSKLYLQSLFINNFASFIGGDSLRAYQIGRSAKRIIDATLSVLISRAIMFYTILLMAGFMTWGWAAKIGWGKQAQLLGFVFTGILLLAIPSFWLLNKNFTRQYLFPKTWLKSERFSHIFKKSKHASRKLHGHFDLLILVFLLSLLAQVLSAWAVWWLASAMNMPITWWQLLLFLSIIGVALILPISFNGIGLREIGLVGLLTSIGIDGSQALALSVSTSLLIFLISFVGGILLLIDFARTQFKNRSQHFQ